MQLSEEAPAARTGSPSAASSAFHRYCRTTVVRFTLPFLFQVFAPQMMNLVRASVSSTPLHPIDCPGLVNVDLVFFFHFITALLHFLQRLLRSTYRYTARQNIALPFITVSSAFPYIPPDNSHWLTFVLRLLPSVHADDDYARSRKRPCMIFSSFPTTQGDFSSSLSTLPCFTTDLLHLSHTLSSSAAPWYGPTCSQRHVANYHTNREYAKTPSLPLRFSLVHPRWRTEAGAKPLRPQPLCMYIFFIPYGVCKIPGVFMSNENWCRGPALCFYSGVFDFF